MDHQFHIGDYKELLLFLTMAGIVVPVFRRLRVSPVLGFIAAGVLLGPFALGQLARAWPPAEAFAITNVAQIAKVAELGVAFLLFMIGLELSFERLRRMRKLVFGLGAAQVILSALVIGELAVLAGLDASAATVIAGALALSSTAIVMPVLADRKRLNTTSGRVAFSILLFQDLMVAPLLFMVTMLGGATGESTVVARLASTLLPALLALGAILGVGRLLIRPLFNHVAQARSTEFFMAACLLVVIGASAAAAAAGLSMALGAFCAGILLAETEYRREVEVTIEPFKGLLLGLFFMTVGAGLDLTKVAAEPMRAVGVAALLIALKAVVVFTLLRASRFNGRTAREVALLLGPGGEFAFVMLGAGMAGGVVEPALAAQLTAAVTLSMVAIPFLAMIGGGPAPASAEAEAAQEAMAPGGDHTDHVIVVGFGRVGALVCDMLRRHDVPFIAVDGDARLVARARDEGQPIYWGDATRREFLDRCGLDTARALVLTMDAPRAADLVVQAARAARPAVTIVARARDAQHATHLYELGASDAIPETIEASLQLAEAVLVDVGVPMGFVIASIHEKRDEYRAILRPRDGAPRERRAIRMSTRVKAMTKEPRAEG